MKNGCTLLHVHASYLCLYGAYPCLATYGIPHNHFSTCLATYGIPHNHFSNQISDYTTVTAANGMVSISMKMELPIMMVCISNDFFVVDTFGLHYLLCPSS